MELFLEFVFTVSLSLILSFILAKFLSFSSVIGQHLEAVSRSCVEVTARSEKCVLECEKGIGFVSEVVKVDALDESVEEKKVLEESLNGSYGGSQKLTEETTEETCAGEEDLVNETTEIELATEEEEKEEIEVLECEEGNGGDCLKEGLSDDDDDDDWEGIERSELEKDFGAAVLFMECTSNDDQMLKLGNDVKMQLYGFHKIATEGPCHEPQPLALKLSARAKWNAWKRLGNMSQEMAMEQYITLLSRNIPGWTQEYSICGESKVQSANMETSRELPLETMSENQTITVNYRRRIRAFFPVQSHSSPTSSSHLSKSHRVKQNNSVSNPAKDNPKKGRKGEAAMDVLIRASSAVVLSPCANPTTPINKTQFLTKPNWTRQNLMMFKPLVHKNTSKSELFTALSSNPATAESSGKEKFDWYSEWYPVMPVCDLDKRVPHAKKVLGLDLVVWWDRNEKEWKVFDDSCPHRLAPLSEGRIDQWGRLQCV
ncbi:Acyl-CoA-binding protein, ACBP [Corchorus olitorius]|uniref:Acyl-CoA-binding protein, ACBP n=1 Tax=Corchorus olitorius TaxID=93759 RepID=A0A1R3K419_9ROSI|nr:Acyl-CoA-binding protein, ACBP [Corchorus olitorius]